MPDEIDRGALRGVAERCRDREQNRRGPGPAGRVEHETDDEVDAEVQEPETVGRAIEGAAEACGGAAPSRELSIRAIEEIRDDEECESNGIEPGTRVDEQVTRGEPDDDTDQGHLIGCHPRRIQDVGDPRADGPEKAQIEPFLDFVAFGRERIGRRAA